MPEKSFDFVHELVCRADKRLILSGLDRTEVPKKNQNHRFSEGKCCGSGSMWKLIVSFLIQMGCLWLMNKKAKFMTMDKRMRFEDDYTERLREEGLYADVEAAMLKKVIAATLARQMERRGVTISSLAKSLGTSRAALNRVLDPANTSITLMTLARTAAALGCKVKMEIVVPR
jgi:antitoxin HicB